MWRWWGFGDGESGFGASRSYNRRRVSNCVMHHDPGCYNCGVAGDLLWGIGDRLGDRLAEIGTVPSRSGTRSLGTAPQLTWYSPLRRDSPASRYTSRGLGTVHALASLAWYSPSAPSARLVQFLRSLGQVFADYRLPPRRRSRRSRDGHVSLADGRSLASVSSFRSCLRGDYGNHGCLTAGGRWF